MNRLAAATHQLGRSLLATIVFALVLGGGLVYGLYRWSKAPTPGLATVSAVAPTPADALQIAVTTSPTLAERAATALQAQRLFVPAGENAFELYLDALAAEPQDTLARNALTDLFPYAVMQVEQRLQAQDADEAARLLGLMQRADPAAPALSRLTAALAATRGQIAASTQAAEATRLAITAANRTAATAVAAPPPQATTTVPRGPAPAATTRLPPAAPSVSAIATAMPRPQTTPPTPAAPASMPKPATDLPPVLAQVPARYPPQAQKRRIEGRVELQFTIGTDGRVSGVSVLSSEPQGVFDREAVGAMQRWRFAPVPQAVTTRRVFDFKLAGAPT